MSQIEDRTLRLPDSLYRQILDQTFDGIFFVDDLRRILYWNQSAERITGFSFAEVAGQLCFRDDGVCHIGEDGSRLCQSLCPLLRAISNGVQSQQRVYLRHKQGHWVPIDAVTSPVYRDGGQVIGAVQVFRDASAYERAERVAEINARLAITDPLTGLLNRRAMEVELEIEEKRSLRLNLSMSVIFGDLDYFKLINDQHGHAVGDEVLRDISRLLTAGVREYDRTARYGGDEFLVMLPGTKAEIAQEVAERIRQAVSIWKLIHHEKRWSLSITMSFGVAELRPGETWEQMVDRADQALYRAKKAGRNQVFVS